MFDNFKTINYPKALVSPEAYARQFSRLFSGDVISGLTVVPGTGLKVILQPGETMIRYNTGSLATARFVGLVDNFELTIPTPDVSNPRIDVVVVYTDNAVSLPSGTPTAANLDGPGVSKAKIVSGNPAASPSAPSAVAIQSSVGAGNPYTVVAEVTVDAGVSLIAANKIKDVRNMAKLRASNIDFATFKSGNYSAAEEDTGFKYIDGKAIYRKTLNVGSLPNNSPKNIPHGVSNMATLVSEYGSAQTAGGVRVPLPFVSVSSPSANIALTVEGANVVVTTGSDRSVFSGYVTIEYTKA